MLDGGASVADGANIDGANTDGPTADALVPDGASVQDAATDDATISDARPTLSCGTGADAQVANPPGTLRTLSQNQTADTTLAVRDFAITADNTRVVFIGDTEADGVDRLYSVPIAGGAVTTLSPNTGPDADLDVEWFRLSPDGNYAVFAGDAEVDEVRRLYSVPVVGGSIVTLSQNSGTEIQRDVGSFYVSPDSSRVVFWGHTEAPAAQRLYSVPISGGTVTTLWANSSASPWLAVRDVMISPDSQWVVYLGDTVHDGVRQIWSVPIGGGTAQLLSGNSQDDDSYIAFGPFDVSPDSGWVVFAGDVELDGVSRVYSVPIGGGARTALSQNTSTDVGLDAWSPSFSPDGQTVLFRGDPEVDGVDGLFAAPVGGGPVVSLSPGILVNPDSETVAFTPDSEHVVFHGRTIVDTIVRVFSTSRSGGAAKVLSPNISGALVLAAWSPEVGPNSRHVVFRGDAVIDTYQQIYSTCVSGGTVLTLSPNNSPLLAVSGAGRPVISRDGAYLFFRGDIFVDDAVQLLRVDVGGGPLTQLDHNTAGVPGLHVAREFAVSSDGNWVVFMGDTEVDGVVRLYSRDLP